MPAMRTTLLTALFALPLISSGCAAVLGIGAGVIISQDLLDNNTFVARIEEDVEVAWTVSKASLGGQSDMPVRVNEAERGAIARIDGADVTMSIEAYDENTCQLIVSARKFGVPNGEIAQLVFNRILENFDGKR
jgi:hypothetical protein